MPPHLCRGGEGALGPWSVAATHFNRVCHLLQNLLKPCIIEKPSFYSNCGAMMMEK